MENITRTVEQIKEKVKKAFEYKQEWTDQARDNISKFMNDDWRKNKKKDLVVVPLIYWSIKTKLARDLEPLYTPEDLVGVKAVEPADETNAEITGHLTNWHLRNTPDSRLKFWMLHLQKRVCGTSPYMCVWEYKIDKTKRRDPLNMAQKAWNWLLKRENPVKEVPVVRAYPNWEVIDFFNFYVEPGAMTIDSAAYCGRKLKMRLSDLKKSKEDYTNLDELEKRVRGEKSTLTTSAQEEAGVKPAPLADDEIIVEVIDHWTDDRRVMISNDLIIKDIENPYWHKKKPFGAVVNDPELLKFYGRGEPEFGECLNDMYNTLRQERIKNIRITNDKIFMIKEGSGEAYSKWKIKPGAKWKVKNFDNIKELQIADIKYSSRDELELIRAEYERTCFVSGYQTGADSPQMNDTATGVSVITFEANKIFTLHRQLDESMGIERIGDFYIKMLHQFMRKEQVIRIVGNDGEKWIKARPENLLSNYDLYATGTSRMVNKQAYLQQLLNLYQLFRDDPEINRHEFKKEILAAAELKGRDKLLVKQGQLKLPGMDQPPPGMPAAGMPENVPENLPDIVEGAGIPPQSPELHLTRQVNSLPGGLPVQGGAAGE